MEPDRLQVPRLNGLSASDEEVTKRLRNSVEISEENFTYMSMETSPSPLKGLDLHLDLEDMENNSDSYDEDGDWEAHTSESEDELKYLGQANVNSNHPILNGNNQQEDEGALLPYDDGIDVDSEEEREIMKEIKNEITGMVRGEMKSELEFYQSKTKALENGSSEKQEDVRSSNDDPNLDPKIKDAIIKMRKLDRILAKKIKRERQVKADRIMLEKRIKEEIEGLKPLDGGKERSDEKSNTMKYLALTLPPSHNEGVKLPSLNNAEPVFTTQLNEKDYPDLHKKGSARQKVSSSPGSEHSNRETSHRDNMSETGSDATSHTSSHKSKSRKKRKNFIKRNKELAAEAENAIPMTDEERQRLDILLADLDTLPELEENRDDTQDETSEYNPFQLSVKPGEGFCPDDEDMRSLSNIDSRLRSILPPDEYASVISASPSYTPQSHSKLFSPVGVDYERFGEKALLENKEQRDLRARLQNIEDELKTLHNTHELEISETPRLEEDQLKDLLDQCVRSLSRTTCTDTSSHVDTERDEDDITPAPLTPTSARQQLLENPPRLSQATLQKLLSEAYCPAASRLSTLREDDEESDFGSIEPETWKVIAQERLDHVENNNNKLNSLQSSVSSDTGSFRVSSALSESSTLHASSRNMDIPDIANNERSGSRESKRPFLPEINRSGSLVAPDLNNSRNISRPSSINSNRSSILTVRNSFDDTSANVYDGTEVVSVNGDTPTPTPPVGEKRTNSSRSRGVTPLNK